MPTKNVDKIAKKKALLTERTGRVLGVSSKTATELLRTKRQQGFRITSTDTATIDSTLNKLRTLGWKGKQFAWCKSGYSMESDKRVVSDSELSKQGIVYVQNAASWLPVIALDPIPGEKILDMCAAPGGKSAHMLQLTDNKADLWVNDNSRSRLGKMQANFKRLGVRATRITLFDITHIAKKLDGEQFDKILLDAPCSGEGMMSLDEDKHFATWSIAHIRRLQDLQKRAILQAWQLLKPGGTLIYSTCTMAPEENEMVIDYALRKLQGSKLVPAVAFKLENQSKPVSNWNNKDLNPEVSKCLRLHPSKNIEAFFVAKIIKDKVVY